MGLSENIEALYREKGFEVIKIERANQFQAAVERAESLSKVVVLWVDRERFSGMQVYPPLLNCPECSAGLVPHTSAGRGFYREYRRLLWCPGCFKNWNPSFKSSGKIGGLINVPKRVNRKR